MRNLFAYLLLFTPLAAAQNYVLVKVVDPVDSQLNARGTFRAQVVLPTTLISGERIPVGAEATMRMQGEPRTAGGCLIIEKLKYAGGELLVSAAGLSNLANNAGQELPFNLQRQLLMQDITTCGGRVYLPEGTLVRFNGVHRDTFAERARAEAAAKAAKAAEITLQLSDPSMTNAEVFVDSTKVGTADGTGTFVAHPSPGTHVLLVTRNGFLPWKVETTFAAGGHVNFTPHLEIFYPPFTEGDLHHLLRGDLGEKYFVPLVTRRGVSFALDEASERRLRADGATENEIAAIRAAAHP